MIRIDGTDRTVEFLCHSGQELAGPIGDVNTSLTTESTDRLVQHPLQEELSTDGPRPADRWNAEYYKKHSGSQFQLGMRVLDSLQFKVDERVLDVGCGEGRLTVEIARRIPKGKILGIDISANMIREAQKTYRDVLNVSFGRIDATEFDIKDVFDRAVSLETFHWIEDQPKALKNIYAALKSGGHLYILMKPSRKNPIFEAMESKKWSSVLQQSKAYFQGHSPETITPLLERCGFVNIDARIKANECVFKNQKDLCDWLMGWVPYATGLVEDKAQEFVQDTTQAFKNCPGDIVCTQYSLHVTAQKPG